MIANLEASSIWFVCEGPDPNQKGDFVYECDRAHDWKVRLIGRTPTSVYLIEASVFYDKKLIRDVAAIACHGCTPGAAAQWVDAHIQTGGEGTIGTIRLSLDVGVGTFLAITAA